ncbi:MAG: nucleoside/nucleotide kinase family protein [Planctomycetota bacterium]
MPAPTADPPLILTDDAIQNIVQTWLREPLDPARRKIVGIAGIAASGKSTLAQRLADELNTAQPGFAAFIPMDGFHLPNAQLEAQGWKPRKGAPFTYDAPAYVDLLRRYRDNSAVGGYPVYCRQVHEPVPSDQRITAATRMIVTEGQYLLCPESPWSELADVLDEGWWLDVDPETTRRWLMKRDISVGRTPEEAEAKYQHNDKLNTAFVLAARRPADRVVRWPDAS